ncbi:MAG: hypothetical protein ABI693_29400 [Bryobacteraceae bacterium]
MEQLLAECASLQCQQMSSQPPTMQQLWVRQQISEAVVTASLDVQSVLAEIASEHARLMELRSILDGRRDRAVSLISAGNLVIGSGVGILVNALQFKDSTAIAGDAIGVGSGAASTLLSIIGIHLQKGPQHAVGRSPNMLSALFGRQAVLQSEYPPSVMAYLNSVPEGEAIAQGTRLEQLRHEWQRAGRLAAGKSKRVETKLDLLTSSLDGGRRLSSGDITDRTFMLQDVAGRVALMERDLSKMMHGLRTR